MDHVNQTLERFVDQGYHTIVSLGREGYSAFRKPNENPQHSPVSTGDDPTGFKIEAPFLRYTDVISVYFHPLSHIVLESINTDSGVRETRGLVKYCSWVMQRKKPMRLVRDEIRIFGKTLLPAKYEESVDPRGYQLYDYFPAYFRNGQLTQDGDSDNQARAITLTWQDRRIDDRSNASSLYTITLPESLFTELSAIVDNTPATIINLYSMAFPEHRNITPRNSDYQFNLNDFVIVPNFQEAERCHRSIVGS